MAGTGKKWQRPKVVFQPEVHRGILKGMNEIVSAVRPTLGPYPRIVLYDKTLSDKGRIPEFLDDGGTIARRIIQIRGRDKDVGAMIARQVLWAVREEVGDGTATAAVILQTAYAEGVRYLASGGNAMRLRVFLEQGLREILDELDQNAFRIEGKAELTRLAIAVTREPELGELLGEIFDIIGEYGRLEIRKHEGRGYEREYVEGMYWNSGIISRAMITDVARQRTELENAAILMTDLEVEDPRDLIPVLGTCVKMGIENLVIVLRKMSDVTVGMLIMNREKGKINVNAIGARTPGASTTDQRAALMDMAVLTGGRPLVRAAGDSIRDVKPMHLGRARRVWADRHNLGIIGGKGNPRQLREYIAHLRELHARTSDSKDREDLQERIGKLLGGSATLRVGGITKTEQDYNKEQAKRAADAMRGAMREGVLPGGGAALLACRDRLRDKMGQSSEPEERAAYRILIKAMEAPTRALLKNAGYEVGEVFSQLNGTDPMHGFDVVSGEVVNMREAGILDITTVVKTAVRSAISTAALALTTDVVVHRAAPPEALNT
ncbi:MAG: chaperonin GroEL [Anaerolineae bacterium]